MSSYASAEEEQEAIEFAMALLMALLMPEDMVRLSVSDTWAAGMHRDQLTSRMADLFDVTTEVMAARLLGLGIYT